MKEFNQLNNIIKKDKALTEDYGIPYHPDRLFVINALSYDRRNESYSSYDARFWLNISHDEILKAIDGIEEIDSFHYDSMPNGYDHVFERGEGGGWHICIAYIDETGEKLKSHTYKTVKAFPMSFIIQTHPYSWEEELEWHYS